jgi:hypothetical protein
MKRTLATLSVLLIGAAVVGYMVLHAEPDEGSAATPRETAGRPIVEATEPALESAAAVAHPVAQPARPVEQGEADALEDIGRIRSAAQNGDADAQFRLYELTSGCNSEYAYYYGKGDALLGKEEARSRMEAFTSMDEYAVEVYRMCHRLMEEQPSLAASGAEWLEKALAQNHPRAMVSRAAELLAAASVANPATGKTAPANARRDARALLKKSVASADPHVLWMLGELRPALGGSAEDANRERWALHLVACSRGLECDAGARWVKRYCKADPASLCPLDADAETMIRSKTASDFEMIKMRAREINELIDAGKAAELVP